MIPSRIVCWLLGHRWNWLAVNMRKNINLAHLSRMAGVKADCTRCGVVYDDTFGFDGDVITPCRQDLPDARTVQR